MCTLARTRTRAGARQTYVRGRGHVALHTQEGAAGSAPAKHLPKQLLLHQARQQFREDRHRHCHDHGDGKVPKLVLRCAEDDTTREVGRHPRDDGDGEENETDEHDRDGDHSPVQAGELLAGHGTGRASIVIAMCRAEQAGNDSMQGARKAPRG